MSRKRVAKRLCYKCGVEKALTDANFRRSRGHFRGYCRPCQNRFHRYQKGYGMSVEEYESMLEAQGGACRICGGRHVRALAVDHCHRTGRIRGLLCSNCNTALGMMKDDPLTVARAAAYLEGRL